MKIGDRIIPKTQAGLELADVPSNGDFFQKRNVTCVLKGTGLILKIKHTTIDYDSWPCPYSNLKIGKIKYQNCLVECESGVGWAGAGALVKII